jgi:hypothetical protein
MPGPRALEALPGWVWDTREPNRRSWQRYEVRTGYTAARRQGWD